MSGEYNKIIINGVEYPLADTETIKKSLEAFGVNVVEWDFETGTATIDKTYAEIVEAFNAGRYVYTTAQGEIIAPLISVSMPLSENVVGAVFSVAMEGMTFMLIVTDSDTAIVNVIEDQTLTEDDVNRLIDEAGTPATKVDLSKLETSGVIEETFADGTVKTTTIGFDDSGNPVRVTDGDGNVTELVW